MNLAEQTQYYDDVFSDVDISGMSFSDIEFEECLFRHCQLSEAVFRNCKFLNCTFEQCNLSLVKWHYSRLSELEFIDCKLVGSDWTQADWPVYRRDAELTFKRCIMNDNSFFGLTLHGLKVADCKLHDADFRESDLTESVMTGCDFTNALFQRTNLNEADLTDSTAFNINVLENKVTDAKFSRFEALALLESLGIELVD